MAPWVSVSDKTRLKYTKVNESAPDSVKVRLKSLGYVLFLLLTPATIGVHRRSEQGKQSPCTLTPIKLSLAHSLSHTQKHTRIRILSQRLNVKHSIKFQVRTSKKEMYNNT